MTDTPMTKERAQGLLDGATPGPWRWEVSLTSKIVKLCGGDPHKGFGRYDLTVMEFVRWGMSKAAPVFWRWSEKGFGDHKRADEIAVPVKGREHHERWFRDIDHPDARLIAAAPDLARAYLDTLTALESAQAENAALREAGSWLLRHVSGKVLRENGFILSDTSNLGEFRAALAAGKGEQG